MPKKIFYTFSLLAVAVLLTAAGCSSRSADEAGQQKSANEAVDGADSAEDRDGGIMMDDDERIMADDQQTTDGNDAMMDEDSGMTADETDMMKDDSEGAMMDGDKDTMMTGEVKTFTLEAGMFYFTPKEITVNKGDKVKIVLNNAGGIHDWVIDEFNARTKQTKAGETDTVEFTADKTGSFEFYCGVGNHRQQGMVGTLTVK